MLSIVACLSDAEARDRLCQIVSDCCRVKRIDSEVLLQTDDVSQARRVFRRLTNPGFSCLHISAPSKDAATFAREVSDDTEGSPLLVTLNRPEALVELINTGVRPAGVLLHPWDDPTARACCTGVLQRYAEGHIQPESKVAFHFGRRTYYLYASSILYAEACEKKVELYTVAQKLTITQTLKEVLAQLDDRFVQCHRSYAVNLHAVEAVDYARMEILLRGDYRVPLARACKAGFSERIDYEH